MLRYYEEEGYIGTDQAISYESFSLEHLPVEARRRLAELHNEQPELDYEAAEQILIDEGLYQPHKED